MKFTIVTLFPEVFESVFASSILARAQKKDLITIEYLNLREFGIGPHKTVDDKPYGGGTGMVIRIDVTDKALKSIKREGRAQTILLEPVGKVYSQTTAEELTTYDHLIILCGHYEGFDARIRSRVDRVISIGDFVLSGGEVPAMAIVESVSRLIKGVIPKEEATEIESFSKNQSGRILEFPQYTRPENYEDDKVPQVLLEGNHEAIDNFRTQEAEDLTRKIRPDLLSQDKQ